MKPHWLITIFLFFLAPPTFSQNGAGAYPMQVAMAEPVSGNTESAAAKAGISPKVYKYRVGGVTSFSDVPPIKRAYVIWTPSCYACNPASTIDWESTKLHLQEFGDIIAAAAEKYEVDPALVRALIHAESGFNPKARSPKGAMGLMQLMPGTASDLGVTDAKVPAHNIRGGVQYLASLLGRFKGNVMLAAAAYNAGPEAVEKYAGVPPFAETQTYVKRVNILHQRYRQEQ